MATLLLFRSCAGPEVAALRRALAEQLGADADDYPGLARGERFDALCEAALRRWQSGVGLLADGLLGPLGQRLLGLREGFEPLLPLHQVRALFPATKPANVERYWPYVEAALQACGLVDPLLVRAALGTLRAETEGFLPIPEAPSRFNTRDGQPPFSAYEGLAKLGNSEPGDGARFKGRGFVQLTGRANYQRLGERLGFDLLAQPDAACAPEVAALLLALFLQAVAPRLRKAMAAQDWAAARKLVNGGTHGLERFAAVCTWHPPVQARARKSEAAPATARKDPVDLRDRPYLPPPTNLLDAFPPDEEVRAALPAYTAAGLILNQGQEGACTGFGLACVVNHLRWRGAGRPAAFESVSPHMLYRFARRYDEYAGEDYEGSSCRGALKAFFKHGVCLQADWPRGDARPRYGYTRRAAEQTLGVYFRVQLRAITDLQAAIQQVGAVYASAAVHDGWYALQHGHAERPGPQAHADLPRIEFKGEAPGDASHAFALVGFNREGFVVQNSWGPGWGAGGFGLLSYADWLSNGMDAWVLGLGVPGVLAGRIEAATPAATAAAAQAGPGWWSEEQAYRHSVVLGDDGRVHRYLSEDEPTRSLLHQVAALPEAQFRRGTPRQLLIYAHGGLNSEGDAVRRARALGRLALANGAYPLFMVWKTGLLETLGNLLRGAAPAAGLGEQISERTDALIERTVGRSLVRPIWSEMKANAELAFEAGRGGDLFVSALLQLAQGGPLKLHLVGHSAGAIFLGHLLSSLARRGGLGLVQSIELYAPACSIAFANRHYAAHPGVLERLQLNLLSERREREDAVGGIYRKSLLWLVANALETDRRTPLLGLAAAWDPAYSSWEGSSSTAEALRQWRRAVADSGLQQRLRLLDADSVATAPGKSIRADHGCFDNDLDTVRRTLERICGAPLAAPPLDLRGF